MSITAITRIPEILTLEMLMDGPDCRQAIMGKHEGCANGPTLLATSASRALLAL